MPPQQYSKPSIKIRQHGLRLTLNFLHPFPLQQQHKNRMIKRIHVQLQPPKQPLLLQSFPPNKPLNILCTSLKLISCKFRLHTLQYGGIKKCVTLNSIPPTQNLLLKNRTDLPCLACFFEKQRKPRRTLPFTKTNDRKKENSRNCIFKHLTNGHFYSKIKCKKIFYKFIQKGVNL